MIKESLCYWLLTALCKRLKLMYDKSLLRAFVTAVAGFCRRVWEASAVRTLLFEPLGAEASFSGGYAGGMFSAVTRFFTRLSSRFRDTVLSSAIVSYAGAFMDSLLLLPLRSYGSFLLSFGGVAALASIIGGARGLWLYLPFGCAAAGALLCIIKSSAAQIIDRSFFARLVLGFFGVEELPPGISGKRYFAVFIIAGIAAALLYAALSPLYFAVAVCAALGFAAIMYKTEIGVMAAAFFAPLMPTMVMLGIAALTVLSFAAKLVLTGGKTLKFQAVDLFAALFALMLALSPLVSYMPGSSLVVAATYLLFVAFYFTVKNTITTKGQVRAIFSILAFSGLVVALYGIYQQITGSYIVTEAWIDTNMFEETIQRIYSTLDNPNVLGEYLIFVISISFAMLYYIKKPLYKLGALGILGAAALCMVLCQSRGAWLGVIFALAVFICLKDRRIILLGLIALPFIAMVLPDSIVERFASIGNMADSSTSYRVNIWMASLVMLRTFWPCGIGLGTQAFEFIYQKYSFNAVYAPHSHNLFLQIIIDLGAAGLIIFVLMMASGFKSLLVTARRSGDKTVSALSAGLCAGLAGFLLQGLTDNVWYNYRIVLFFWMILALAGALHNIANEGAENVNDR